jgi:hypothetical protein
MPAAHAWPAPVAPAVPTVAAPYSVKDKGGNAAWRPLILTKHQDDFIVQMQIEAANVSPRKLYDARATLFSPDYELAEGAPLAPALLPGHQFTAGCKILFCPRLARRTVRSCCPPSNATSSPPGGRPPGDFLPICESIGWRRANSRLPLPNDKCGGLLEACCPKT